jgi:hypothetical protein
MTSMTRNAFLLPSAIHSHAGLAHSWDEQYPSIENGVRMAREYLIAGWSTSCLHLEAFLFLGSENFLEPAARDRGGVLVGRHAPHQAGGQGPIVFQITIGGSIEATVNVLLRFVILTIGNSACI